MANHVNWTISFYRMNDQAKKRWSELTAKLTKEDGDHGLWFGDLFLKEDLSNSEEVKDFEWTVNNIGPKWNYIEEYDETSFFGVSAWGAPIEGLQKLLEEELAPLDPNIISTITYEDEGPNFYGCTAFLGSELEDDREVDWDEMRELVIENNEELQGKWNEDEGDWIDDESHDTFYDCLYEFVSEHKWEIEEEFVKYLESEN